MTKIEKAKKVLKVLLGLGVLAALGYGALTLLKSVGALLSTWDPTLAAGLVAASATVVVSVLSVLISKHFERRAEIDEQHRPHKTKVYDRLIEFIFRAVYGAKTEAGPMSEQEMMAVVAEITPELVVWGSPGVVKAFVEFRQLGSAEDAGSEILFGVEKVLLAIRKDLGHRDSHLARGDLLALFINDIRRYL